MKRLLILTGFVCLIAMLLPAYAPAPEPVVEAAPALVFDQAAEEAAVKTVIAQMYATNNNDVPAYMALCAKSFKSGDSKIVGCAAWEKYATDLWERMPDVHLRELEVVDIHFVSPDVAIYKALQETTGRLDENGKTEPPFKRYVARVFVKEEDGQWRYATFYFFPILEE